LNRAQIRVVGEFFIAPGYGADGMVLMSDDTFGRLTVTRTLDRPAMGLLKLKPGCGKKPAQVKNDLLHNVLQAAPYDKRTASRREHSQTGDEVQIFTRDEIRDIERHYWLYRTSVGIIFFVGVVVALFVGVIFVYQVIATDISDHVAEYATLRAIGYGPGYLSGVVLKQALALAVLGYLPALGVAFLLYAWGRDAANLLLSMTLGRAAFVLVLSIAMCSLSGLMALRKVKKADPAEMF
jgi:putative ABC transport system permease protein